MCQNRNGEHYQNHLQKLYQVADQTKNEIEESNDPQNPEPATQHKKLLESLQEGVERA
jgi:hypothetical protein